ncbi:unnamed protein product, partial [Lymnaea stagnalis]
MLTPKFSITQDADFIYILIKAPHIKLSETDSYVNDDEFYFYSQPYYLRLHLPGCIQDNEQSTSQYDVDTGQLTVRIAKQNKGEHFDGLNLLTKLLTPKKGKELPEIEVVGPVIGENNSGESDEDGESSWFLEQIPNEEPEPIASLGLKDTTYGFANKKRNTLNQITTELTEIIDLRDPDNTPQQVRRQLREQQELDLFNCEHYLADFFDDELIQELIIPDFPELTGTVGLAPVLTEKETEKLLQLPRREYIIDKTDLEPVYYSLVDLVFAYAYNFRFTNGEQNVESDWTVCKLSGTLSWLESFQNIKDVVVSCARRSVTFPLYRNWKLFNRVLSDVKTIFNVGKTQILKCLLGIHSILSESDVRHPLNNLYITDYCIWVQSADSKRFELLAKALSDLNISKSDLGLNLDDMESDAKKLIEEKCHESETHGDDIAHIFDNVVKLTEAEISDSDDCSDSDEETDASSDDASSDDTSESPELCTANSDSKSEICKDK